MAHASSSVRPAASDVSDDDDAERELPWQALELREGAALVVDTSLHVVGATRAAERLLGGPIRKGQHLARVLSGADGEAIVEAMTEGRAVVASVPSGDAAHESRARVRVTPLRDGARRTGWLVRLSPERADEGEPRELGILWTRDPATKRAFAAAELVAPTDTAVIVEGERGTGRATLAAAIHARSSRASMPLRTVACAAMTPALLERQLVVDAPCTLLLDDVGELTRGAQAYLLRALESASVTPLDGAQPTPVDVRVLATGPPTAARRLSSGGLGAALLERIGTVPIAIPPLRARRGDVAPLAERFCADAARRARRSAPRLSDEALAVLERYDWPGNVRELRAAVEHAVVLCAGPIVRACDLPARIAEDGADAPASIPPSSPAVRAEGERARIQRALQRTGGDRTRAAAMLGMSRTSLWRRMRTYGLSGGS
jgi:DNA-binding NtrC family response regulator